MVVVRRAVAVFLAAFGVLALFFYPRSCVGWLTNPPSYACELRPADDLWWWLIAGLFVVGAAALWVAPWKRRGDQAAETDRLWISAQVKRVVSRVGGWVLVGLGSAVIFYSVAGLFRSASACAWEIGCYEFDFYLSGAFREDGFSLIRVVGVLCGVALVWWGFLELRLGVEPLSRVIMVGLGFGFLAMVLADPLGYGFAGLGAVQLVGLVSVLVLMLGVLARRRLLGDRDPLGSLRGYHRDLLLVAMSASILLGAWVAVLDRIEPRCAGLVRCEHELSGASVLAASVAAAGLYLAYARWQAAASTPTTDPRHQAMPQ